MASILDRIKSFFSKKKDEELIAIPQNIKVNIPTIDLGARNSGQGVVKTQEIKPIDLSVAGSNLTKSLANLFKTTKPEQKPQIEIPPPPKVEAPKGPDLGARIRSLVESKPVQQIREIPAGKVGIRGLYEKDINVGNVSDLAGEFLKELGPRYLLQVGMIRDRIATGKPQSYKPQTDFEKFLLGNEEVKDYFEQFKNLSKSFGAGEKTSRGVALPLTALALIPGIGSLSKKVVIESSDDLARVLKEGLKIKPVVLDEGEEAVRVVWKDADKFLKKVNVDKKLLEDLKSSKVIEGDGYVIQKQGDQLLVNIDESFQPSAKLKTEGVDLNYKPAQEEIEAAERQAFGDVALDVKQAEGAKFGEYKEVATKMKNFLKIAGENRSSKESKELFREHIPSRVFGVSSDEVASALGKSETEFMQELTKDLDIVSSGKANAQVIGRMNERVKKLKNSTIYEKLDPEFYNFVRDWDNQVKVISVEATPETLAKVAAKEEKLLKPKVETPEQQANRLSKMIKEGTEEAQSKGISIEATPKTLEKVAVKQAEDEARLAKESFEEWQKALLQTVGTRGTREAIKIIEKGIKEGTGFPKQPLLTGAVRDKAPLLYQRETLLRNIEDTFKNKEDAVALKNYLYKPITENETANVKFKNEIRKKLKEEFDRLGIKRGSDVDYATADFIEGTITKEDLVTKFGQKQADDIVTAAEMGREVYQDLLTRINNEITKYGYEPIAELNNYVTHTQVIEAFAERFGSFLNITKEKLPTEMSAINIATRPGKQFFAFALQRRGGSTHEGMITALDKYLDPAGNQIFHTADVQRVRDVQKFLERNIGKGDTRLSNFNSWIGQYADFLAGKKHIIDRPVEKTLGRGLLSVGDWARKKLGVNAIGGSLSTALTNFIPLTYSAGTTSKPAFLKGLFEAGTSSFRNPVLVDGVESGFLLRRFPVERIAPSATEKVVNTSFILFRMVDKFVSRTVVAGKYYENIAKGMTKDEAMQLADEYAARLITDRSYGQIPILFSSKILGPFTQFQVEVNNALSFVFKDIPKNLNYDKKGVALALSEALVFSYLYNNLYENVVGWRPVFDPLGVSISLADNIIEGEELTEIIDPTDQDSPVGQIVNTLPFTSIFTGGRIPIGAAIPDVIALAKGETDLGSEILKPLAYLVPPAAGGQVKKTTGGLLEYGQEYAEDKRGLLKYPIEGTTANLLRATFFGQYSFPEAQRFYDEELPKMSRDETITLRNLLATSPSQALDLYEKFLASKEITSIMNDISQARGELILEVSKPGITEEQKQKAIEEYIDVVEDTTKKLNDKVKGMDQTEKEILDIGAELQLKGATSVGELPTIDMTKIPTAGFGLDTGGPAGTKGISLGGGKTVAGTKPKKIAPISPTKFKGPKLSVKKQKQAEGIEVDTEIPAPPRTLGIDLSGYEKPEKVRSRKFRVSKFRVA